MKEITSVLHYMRIQVKGTDMHDLADQNNNGILELEALTSESKVNPSPARVPGISGTLNAVMSEHLPTLGQELSI